MKPKDTQEKSNLHPRNAHRQRYDFAQLIVANPELENFVRINEHQIETIDFSDPEAVKMLNKALLAAHYAVENWNIPEGYLCPPIPGRADYIHNIADLLANSNNGIIPEGDTVSGLDVGVGSNCIYPLIGNAVYGWSFVGTDIDPTALDNCVKILESNPQINEVISLQQQMNGRFIFKDIIGPADRFDFTICNPPFHCSEEEATKGTLRKIGNLENTKPSTPVLNFGGQGAELWCDGGEVGFITKMIYESARYPLQCFWFTTLVSKNAHLHAIYKTLNKVNAATIITIDMAQGQKTSRIVAWTFLSESQQKAWKF